MQIALERRDRPQISFEVTVVVFKKILLKTHFASILNTLQVAGESLSPFEPFISNFSNPWQVLQWDPSPKRQAEKGQ